MHSWVSGGAGQAPHLDILLPVDLRAARRALARLTQPSRVVVACVQTAGGALVVDSRACSRRRKWGEKRRGGGSEEVAVARALTEPVTASRDVHVALADGLQTRVARVLEVRHGGPAARASETASWTLAATRGSVKESRASCAPAGHLTAARAEDSHLISHKFHTIFHRTQSEQLVWLVGIRSRYSRGS